MWHTAIGYEIAGLTGMLLLGVIVWGLGTVIVRRGTQAEPHAAHGAPST
jgi:hypothetical protein